MKSKTIQKREIKPAPSEELRFLVPDIKKFNLSNGLTVLLVERHNLPIIRVNLMTDCGSKYDPVSKKGLANLFSMCIDEGAGGLNALELSNEFDLIGSDFDIHCTPDNIYFLSRSLKENLYRTIELFSSVILHPHLNDEEFQKERRKILTRIIQMKDDPDEIASNSFEGLIFNMMHPYAYPSIGLEKDIQTLKIEDIRNFYKYSLTPENSHLILVGDLTVEESAHLAEKYFGSWKNSGASRPIIDEPGHYSPGVYFIDKPGSVQSEIRIGHPSAKRGSSNYFNRLLLNLILGGQFSSRINLNLRENKGYTYGAFSNFSFYRDAGYFFISTSVASANTFYAYTEIMNELKSIRKGVTEEELIFSKTSMMRKFPSNFETNGQIASSLSRLILYDLSYEHFKNYLQMIHSVTIDQVDQAALDYIFPDKTITLIVGNKKDIITQFKDFELVELDYSGNPV